MLKGSQYDLSVSFIMNVLNKYTQYFAQYGIENLNSRGCSCTFSSVF